MNFTSWLIKSYLNSDCGIGDLARDVAVDEDFPRGLLERNTYLEYFDRIRACDGAIEMFEKAWSKFVNAYPYYYG